MLIMTSKRSIGNCEKELPKVKVFPYACIRFRLCEQLLYSELLRFQWNFVQVIRSESITTPCGKTCTGTVCGAVSVDEWKMLGFYIQISFYIMLSYRVVFCLNYRISVSRYMWWFCWQSCGRMDGICTRYVYGRSGVCGVTLCPIIWSDILFRDEI